MPIPKRQSNRITVRNSTDLESTVDLLVKELLRPETSDNVPLIRVEGRWVAEPIGKWEPSEMKDYIEGLVKLAEQVDFLIRLEPIGQTCIRRP